MSTDASDFYTIRIEGILDDDWAEWFAGMSVSCPAELPGQTIVSGYVADQAALHGVLNKIRDLNMRLIAVERGKATPVPGAESSDQIPKEEPGE